MWGDQPGQNSGSEPLNGRHGLVRYGRGRGRGRRRAAGGVVRGATAVTPLSSCARSATFSAASSSYGRGASTVGRAAAPATATASEYFNYVSIDATTTRASTVIRSIPTNETRTHASMTIPLSSTRSRTSIRLVPPAARSTAIVKLLTRQLACVGGSCRTSY